MCVMKALLFNAPQGGGVVARVKLEADIMASLTGSCHGRSS